MVRAVHEKDWGGTRLGPVSTWPESIRNAVDICLNSLFPMVVLCGSELVYIYNDAAIPIFGDKHPWALGQRAADVWAEVWSTIGPMLTSVLNTGEATRHDDLLLPLQRRGFTEECYFTFSYSPVRVAGNAIGGVFVATLETTDRVVNDRRVRTLTDLATQVALGQGGDNTFGRIDAALGRNPYDIPFTALYLEDTTSQFADRVFCSGLDQSFLLPPARIALRHDGEECGHPIARALQTSQSLVCDITTMLVPGSQCGAWPEQPKHAVVLPFKLPGEHRARGALVVGANPRKPLDNDYRAFLDLVVGHISTAVANAEAVEAERRRVEAMAELDRTKSQFFSNASHELRTPVTLILGPLEQILANECQSLSQGAKDGLGMAYRNARRLHRLVNSIMDFASIEAGRLLMHPEPTDIARFTGEIASLFRSAIDAAGLVFTVQCPASIPNVFVDREMWEKVVLNLISNAFKFTLQGEIQVTLESDQDSVHLRVCDTGCGIAPHDLPHIFERFFRSSNTSGRSVEGSGIGLSLVHELVRLHGGTIDVESVVGVGSVFSVTIPARLVPAVTGGDEETQGKPVSRQIDVVRRSFVDEAQRYVAHNEASDPVPKQLERPESQHAVRRDHQELVPSGEPVRVVVIDDNKDMTRYISRLLEDSCTVISRHDGVSGLEAIHSYLPDLVLMDVMMPGMDGFELLRAIRANERIHTVSVIMLSARTGEEARLEALEAGADDYLVKPFSARELVTRVRTHVQMVKTRRNAVERENELLQQIDEVQFALNRVLEGTTDAFVGLDRQLRIVTMNDVAAQLMNTDKANLIGRIGTEVSPDVLNSELESALRSAIERQVITEAEHYYVPSGRWLSVRCYPVSYGLMVFANDITERKQAAEVLRIAHAELELRVVERTRELSEASKLLSAVFDRAPVGIALADIDGQFIRANAAYQKLVGYTEEQLQARSMESVTDPIDFAHKRILLQQLLGRARDSFAVEMRYIRSDGRIVWVNNFVSTIDDEQGHPRYFVKIAQDITDRKEVEREILSSREELRILYDRLQTVREEERVALAREVHDQLGQILSAAKIDIKLLEDDIRPHDAPLSRRKITGELRSASRTLDKAIHLVRQIATDLRAPELEYQGLYAAIDWHARDFERRTRIKCNVVIAHDVREPKGAIATTLFRVFQEAMTNVVRHAKARQVEIRLVRRGGSVVLRVCDNGIGISHKNARSSRSLGLMGMRERTQLVNGRLVVGRLRRSGTLVSARIPLSFDQEKLDNSSHLPQGDGT